VLDQHVLKSASRSDQRYVPLARFPYDFISQLGIAIRAAWPYNNRRSRSGDAGHVANCVGGHDLEVDRDPQSGRRMFEGGQGRFVVSVICRQIN
jgi:hypothetical protein